MTSLNLCVGLDYHDDSIRVCVMDADGRVLANRNRANDVGDVAEYIYTFGIPRSVAIEACCGAADFISELSRRYPFEVRMAHPGYVRRLKQSPDKTDYDDAELLADLLRVNYLPDVWIAPEETRQLRRLARYRQGLAVERKRIKQQIRSLLREERLKCDCNARPWTKRWFQWVQETAPLGEQSRWVMQQLLSALQDKEEQLKRVEERFEEITKDDPLTQQLLLQPGIGLVTAFVLRAEIGSFHRFRNGKQLARFCSVTPLNASSGKRQADAGIVRQANPELRRIVIEAAQRISRYETRWMAMKTHLVKQGKPPSVATVAVANRWMRSLYHQIIAAVPMEESAA